MRANVPVLLACIFLMGLHSTLFGPVKYAYLPQQLSERELTGGNGMVEMGTFVAILLGSVAGGLLVALPRGRPLAIVAACVVLAVVGRAGGAACRPARRRDPDAAHQLEPVHRDLAQPASSRTADLVVFRSLLGISWMWFFGAVFLAQFPSFAKDVLHGDEQVASLLLAVFSVGIGIGSLLCEMLAGAMSRSAWCRWARSA